MCLHHKVLNCTWTCLHYRRVYCTWTCLHLRGLSCTRTCLDNRNCAAPGRVYTTWSELHLDLPAKRSFCGSWMCLHYRPELHLDVFRLQEPVLLLMDLSNYTEVCAGAWTASRRTWPTGAFAGLDISTRYHSGLSCTWTYLHYRGLWCIWTCQQSRVLICI